MASSNVSLRSLGVKETGGKSYSVHHQDVENSLVVHDDQHAGFIERHQNCHRGSCDLQVKVSYQ